MMIADQVVVTLTPENASMSCRFLQNVDDQLDENLEVLTFSLLSGDPAITGVDPNGGQIRVVDNDGNFNSWQ